MKIGVFGLAAYLWLMGTALFVAFRLWRHHPDPLHRAIGLGAFAGIAGLMVAETTGPSPASNPASLLGRRRDRLAGGRLFDDGRRGARTRRRGRHHAPVAAAGRRALTSGIAVVRQRKSWAVAAAAAAMMIAGAVALAVMVSGLASGA